MNIQDALRTEAPVTEELTTRMVNCIRPLHALMGMATEVGELIDQYKRHIFYGAPLDPINIKEEMGDKFWYDSLMLDVQNASFEECFQMMVNKLKKRYPEKFTELDAVQRDLEGERKVLEQN